MTPCASGEYSITGQASCTDCPSGSYCSSRSSPPSLCPQGSYSIGRQTICTLADPGYAVPLVGSSQQQICGTGFYSSGGAASCTLCSPGYMCLPGSTQPSPPSAACPIGGYCSSPTLYTPCPAGTYGIIEAGTSQAQACAVCQAGYVCGLGSTFATRQLCPPGSYCPVGSSAAIGCPPGFKTYSTGQISLSACEVCSRGYYCSHFGNINGTVCPAGYYCPEGTATYLAFPCPGGTYSDSSGLYTASQCSNCTSGHYCPAGSITPSACSAGTYNPFYGLSDPSCFPCEAGYSCPYMGMTALSNLCAAGYYCPPGTISATQYACPPGTYSDSTNLVSQSSCSQCPAGYSCGSHTTTSTLVSCKLGHYCAAGTALGFDSPCPAGTYSSVALLKSSSQCTACLPGKYCVGGNTTISGSCATGHYCPEGTKYPNQYSCPAGTYSNSTNLYSSSQCTICPAGYHCIAGSSYITKCSAGTYASTSGSSSCQICEAGYYCPVGSIEPSSCGVGYYSAVGSSICLICPLGKYCGSNTTAESVLVTYGGLSGTCPAGTYCGIGMKESPDLLRYSCPQGYYCPVGIKYSIPCPAGRYNSFHGQSTLEEGCTLTPSRYYSTIASIAPSGLCSPGYYCPIGSSSPHEVPCPSRTYLPDFGGESKDQCSICTAGGYCLEGAANPTVCPKGYYCVSGISAPLPCLPGTYSNQTGLLSSSDCQACDPGKYCDGYALVAPRGYSSSGIL